MAMRRNRNRHSTVYSTAYIRNGPIKQPTTLQDCVFAAIVFVTLLITLGAILTFIGYVTGTAALQIMLHGPQIIKYMGQKVQFNPQNTDCKYVSVNLSKKDDSNAIYINNFPSNVTIEEIIKKRNEPIENIPICPNANKTNFNQYKDILSKLPSNYIYYTNRCQINAINRYNRQFGGLLSGDPLKPLHSTQIGFLHVYKAGI